MVDDNDHGNGRRWRYPAESMGIAFGCESGNPSETVRSDARNALETLRSSNREPEKENALKVWIHDQTVFGCLVVIASSEEEARKMMEGNPIYWSEDPVVSFPIQSGFLYASDGGGV